MTTRATVRTYELGAAGVVIGSGDSCDVRDTDASVQPRHCRVFADGDAWMVEDLNSRAGTFVNGRRVLGLQRIVPGDRLRCAGSSLELAFEVAPAEAGDGGAAAIGDAVLREEVDRQRQARARLEQELAAARAEAQQLQRRCDELVARVAADQGARDEAATSSIRRDLGECTRRCAQLDEARRAAEQRAAGNDELITELRVVIDDLQRRLAGVES